MSDTLHIVIDKYHDAINRFNEENKNNKENDFIYQIRCFADFVKLRFYIYIDKLYKEDYINNLSATVYIEMEDLEKQNIYTVDFIYKTLKDFVNKIY